MTMSIYICPSAGTISNSLVTDIADEIRPHEKSFERRGIELRFIFSETAFFSGSPAETLVIAISGGVALHLITKSIDAVLKAIAKRKEAAKERDKSEHINSQAQQPTFQPSLNKFDIHLNSASMEYHSLSRIRVVVRDTDQNVDFAIEEERSACLKHFAGKIGAEVRESASKKEEA